MVLSKQVSENRISHAERQELRKNLSESERNSNCMMWCVCHIQSEWEVVWRSGQRSSVVRDRVSQELVQRWVYWFLPGKLVYSSSDLGKSIQSFDSLFKRRFRVVFGNVEMNGALRCVSHNITQAAACSLQLHRERQGQGTWDPKLKF